MGMDEILIEEKKYISSKQAAKITGYAKDYIGQLCREGRVPARLVGRSWYVLETAIKDHKFGDKDASEDLVQKTAQQKPELELAPKEDFLELPGPDEPVGFPRYELSHTEMILPTLNRLQKIDASHTEIHYEQEIAHKETQDLQESWKEWFDRASETLASVELPIQEDTMHFVPQESQKEERTEEIYTPDDTEESVPLRIVPTEPAQEPQQTVCQIPEAPSRTQKQGIGRGTVFAIRFAGLFVALCSIAIASVGTGYFDAYVSSVYQAQIISGISIYNK